MTSPHLQVLKSEPGLLRVTIDRRNKANAVNRQMLRDLSAVLTAAAGDPNLRAVILTGAGSRVFCAGADLTEVTDDVVDRNSALAFDRLWDAVAGQIANLPLLTLALIQGACAGGGLSLALACDLRVARTGAEIFYPVLRHGLLPSPRDVARLTALAGPARAKALLLGGARLTADQAAAWGLLEAVTDRAELETAARAFLGDALKATAAEVTTLKGLCRGFESPGVAADCYRALYDGDMAAIARLRKG